MRLMKKIIGVTLSATLLLTGCNAADNNASNESISEETQNAETNVAWDQIDKTKCNYNSEDNVYWQVGISYCENPVAEEYETLGIFVPGDYMNASDNGDETWITQRMKNPAPAICWF